MRKIISLIVLEVCVTLSGCKGSKTIWAAEVRSPDGKMIASARTVQNGGFGSAAIQTIVYLKQTNAPRAPVEVLGFWCDGPAARPYVLADANAGGTIHLTMRWMSPSHLDVTYDGHASLDFQAIKYAGVDISVREFSSTGAVHP